MSDRLDWDEIARMEGQESASAWAHIRALWERLRPSIEKNPAAREAVEEVAKVAPGRPVNERAVRELARQLEELFEADRGLAADVERLWEQVPSRTIIVSGSVIGSTVSVGGDFLESASVEDAGEFEADSPGEPDEPYRPPSQA